VKGVYIAIATKEDAAQVAMLTGELLSEIMSVVDNYLFHFDIEQAKELAYELIEKNIYQVFIALHKQEIVGFISLQEHYALYAGGSYGTISEFYVKSEYRSSNIGKMLISKVKEYASENNYRRVEVTTPPLPEFERSLDFYKKNGFEITGGRKMKVGFV